nr:stage III sporulation protein AF [uncultured Tyzzerella sp.]
MINYFYDYIKNIILFLIFMSFIQVIIPSGKYRSYINLVFNIILVFVMIQPLNFLFNNIKNVEALTIFKEDDFNTLDNINMEKYKNIQNEMVKNAFEENIKRQIESLLNDEYYIQNIDVFLYENKYEEINIEKIDLTLKSNNNNIYVKPFNENKNGENNQEKQINNIKKIISNFYNLNINNIFVTLT